MIAKVKRKYNSPVTVGLVLFYSRTDHRICLAVTSLHFDLATKQIIKEF